MTFVKARWFTETRGRQIDLLVVHSMEIAEYPDTAELCAAYFARTDVKASAHECVDTDSSVTCVLDKDVAYAAPGANHNGMHLELAGRARQSRAEWLDPYGTAMLRGPAASWLRRKSELYVIPLVYLTAAMLRSQQRPRGVTTHNEVRIAYGLTSHTDPGKGFPMDVLLDAARQGTPAPTPAPEAPLSDRTLIPSWAVRDPATNRVPFYRLNPADPTPGEGFSAYVVGYNGAKFAPNLPTSWEQGVIFTVPFVKLRRLAAPAVALAEVETTGAVVVLAEDGGVLDVARRP